MGKKSQKMKTARRKKMKMKKVLKKSVSSLPRTQPESISRLKISPGLLI